ncbi:MAG TPA: hypothetical protein EYO76_13000 [Flavobacteriaceae bacterium]|nr:hypothetical protein [Flavobacteriaceae bacterium]
MKKAIYISIFLLFSICSFSQDKEYKYRLLTYGTTRLHYSKAMEFVGDMWNIEIYGVAGTTVEHRVKDSADTKNAELWKELDKIKKTDSQKEFRNQVRAEFKNIMTAQKLVDSSKKVKNTIVLLTSSELRSYAELESKSENGIYIWVIYTEEKDKYFSTSIAEYYANVDLKTKTIEIERIKKN